MHIAGDDYLIEIFLADLRSETKFIRELAITQLYHHVGSPRVREVLASVVEDESDPFLKGMITSLLAMAPDDTSPGDPVAGMICDKDSLLQRWHRHELLSIKDMLQQIALLPVEQQEQTINELLSEETELSRLIPLFSLPDALLRKPQTIEILAAMLYSNDYIFVIRLLAFLAENGRNHLVKALPGLLKHDNFMVRAEAIRFLCKISKQHALRLLEELIFAEDSSRRSASTFLLLFPFEDVQHIVLSLIDSGALQDSFLSRLLTHLVANNPDAEFFKRLTVAEVLRKDEIPEIEKLRLEAAEALKIAGIIDRNAAEFCISSRERVSEYIQKRAGINIVIEQNPPMPDSGAAAIPKPQTERQQKTAEAPPSPETAKTPPEQATAVPAKSRSTSDAKKLEEMLGQEALTQDDRVMLRRLLLSGQTDGFNDLMLKVLARFKPADSQAIRWLEDCIEKLPTRDVLLALKLLSELNPARIIPHLPVLCVSNDEMIATQAIRLFRKHNLKGLIKQINTWLQDDREQSWKSALTALLQLKTEISRDILIKAFRATNRNSLIKFFAPVFIISPDHMALYELEVLSAESRGNKHELLREITVELKEALGVATKADGEDSGTAALISAGIHIKWEELKQSLEKIRYISGNQLLLTTLTRFIERNMAKALLTAFVILAYLFWPDDSVSKLPDAAGSEVRQTFAINQQIPELKIGENKIFKLESYDPINRTWRATGLDGRPYRLKLPVPGDFSNGFRGDFKVLYFSITRLGYPVVTCDLVAKIK